MSQALTAIPGRLGQRDDDTREALLQAAAQRGDPPLRQMAMLTDRIRFNEERTPGSTGTKTANSAAACKMARLPRRLTNRHCHK